MIFAVLLYIDVGTNSNTIKLIMIPSSFARQLCNNLIHIPLFGFVYHLMSISINYIAFFCVVQFFIPTIAWIRYFKNI